MTQYDNIRLEFELPVAILTLDRPHRKNALSTDTMLEIEAAIEEVDARGEARVVLLRGAGDSFCAGYDLISRRADLVDSSDEASAENRWSDLYSIHDRQRRNAEWWLKVFFNFRKPVIAQVQGHCLAGGMDLLGVCDLVICAENAEFGLPQARGIGVIHTMGLLPYHIGMRRTKEMCFTGDPLDAQDAYTFGLVNKVVPLDDLEHAGMAYAQRIALMPKELLASHKFAIHRFYELMGVDTAAKSAGEYDALAVQNPFLEVFRAKIAEIGLSSALKWRDAMWAEAAAS